MRRTRHGFRPADVEAVYRANGFSCTHGAKHDLFQHRRYLELVTTVRRSDPIKPGYIGDLLALVDEAAQRERGNDPTA